MFAFFPEVLLLFSVVCDGFLVVFMFLVCLCVFFFLICLFLIEDAFVVLCCVCCVCCLFVLWLLVLFYCCCAIYGFVQCCVCCVSCIVGLFVICFCFFVCLFIDVCSLSCLDHFRVINYIYTLCLLCFIWLYLQCECFLNKSLMFNVVLVVCLVAFPLLIVFVCVWGVWVYMFVFGILSAALNILCLLWFLCLWCKIVLFHTYIYVFVVVCVWYAVVCCACVFWLLFVCVFGV